MIGIYYLLLSAFLYSLMPVMIRLLGGGGIRPMSQVFLRYIFAFISAVTYFFVVTKSKFHINKKDLPLFAVATIFCYALTNLFFTYGILYTQVGNALFLFYSYAILTPLLGFVFLKESINKYQGAALFLSLLALYLLFQPNSFPTWEIGGFFALLAALGQSAFVIVRKKLSSYPAKLVMVSNTMAGVIVLGLLAIIFENNFYFHGGITSLNPQTWLVTVLFGVDNFLAWFMMSKGFELFEATIGSLILLVEIIFGIILALIFFKEIPTLMTITGGLLIFLSSAVVILKSKSK